MKAGILRSKKLILRPIKLKDSEIIVKIATKNVSKYFGVIPYPYKIEDAKKWIRSSWHIKDSIDFAITLKDTNDFLGYIEINGINKKSKTGCISYWIGEKYWRKGYMSEAMSLILDNVFKIKALNKIYAQVNGKNIASQMLLKKLGFKLEGTLRSQIFNKYTKELDDKLFYGLFRAEWETH